jgi:hypothetical protein
MKGFMSMGLRGAALVVGVALAAGTASAQRPYNEREAHQMVNVEDREGIWVLDFRFKDPRFITVDIPGKGRTLCLYLWFQVINNTGEPRAFVPDFELVTLDKPAVYKDQILPKAQKAIQELEDPTGHLNIQNPVQLADPKKPIPPSKPDAFPRTVTGVAIWTGVDPEATRLSIFVTGLSNGLSFAESQPDGKPVVRRKTLQLNFMRIGGSRAFQESGEIRFMPPVQWLYRASSLNLPGAKPAAPPAPPAPKPGAALPADPRLPRSTFSQR